MTAVTYGEGMIREQYDLLLQENQKLREEIKELQSQNQSLKDKLKGKKDGGKES